MRLLFASRRIVYGLAFGLVLVFSSGAVSSAASGPVRTVTSIEETGLSPILTAACGFPVTRYASGSLVTLVWFDAQGQPVRATYTFPNTTFELSANGRVLRGNASGPGFEYYHADGSITQIGTGTVRFTTAPGSGVVFGYAGREVVVFGSNGEPLFTDFHGTSGDIAAACAYLAG